MSAFKRSSALARIRSSPFWSGQTGDHPEHHRLPPAAAHPISCWSARLLAPFPSWPSCRAVYLVVEVLVGRRVPLLDVDAVQDPDRAAGPRRARAVSRPYPYSRHAQISRGVGQADGRRDDVREDDPGLHQVEVPVVLHLLIGEVLQLIPCQPHVPPGNFPERHVVDREDRPGLSRIRPAPATRS